MGLERRRRKEDAVCRADRPPRVSDLADGDAREGRAPGQDLGRLGLREGAGRPLLPDDAVDDEERDADGELAERRGVDFAEAEARGEGDDDGEGAHLGAEGDDVGHRVDPVALVVVLRRAFAVGAADDAEARQVAQDRDLVADVGRDGHDLHGGDDDPGLPEGDDALRQGRHRQDPRARRPEPPPTVRVVDRRAHKGHRDGRRHLPDHDDRRHEGARLQPVDVRRARPVVVPALGPAAGGDRRQLQDGDVEEDVRAQDAPGAQVVPEVRRALRHLPRPAAQAAHGRRASARRGPPACTPPERATLVDQKFLPQKKKRFDFFTCD